MKLFNFSLWWAVIGAAIWVGGTVFMMSVIDPQWSADPPDSVRFFFGQTGFNKNIWNFFGPPFMLLRSIVPQTLALLSGWKSRPHRRDLLITLTCTVITVVFTLAYIYPINDILMTHAGGNADADTIRRLTRTWLLGDRIRFAVNLVGFYFLLRAFRRPVPSISGRFA